MSYFFPWLGECKNCDSVVVFSLITWTIIYINSTGIKCKEISTLKVLFPFLARATRHKPHRRRSCCYMKCSRIKIDEKIMDGVESNAATKKLGGALTSRATTYNLTPFWWVLKTIRKNNTAIFDNVLVALGRLFAAPLNIIRWVETYRNHPIQCGDSILYNTNYEIRTIRMNTEI